MDTAIALGRGYCNISKVASIVVMFCCLSIFIWGFSNRNDKSLYTTSAKGELSNVHVTAEKDGRGYSMIGAVTYTFKGTQRTQNITGNKVYSDGQKVQLLLDPKTGDAVLKDAYTSPAQAAGYAMGIACCGIVFLILYFLFLNTDAGCAIAVMDKIF
jgi:hypothetical protein